MKSKKEIIALLTAIVAAVVYGGWAVYANYEHGMRAWVIAGLVQASYAFVSTFSITYVARKVFLKFHCGIRGGIAGFAMSFIVMLAIPLIIHNIAGTPDIWQSMMPGLIWGSIYLIGFLTSLNVKEGGARLT